MKKGSLEASVIVSVYSNVEALRVLMDSLKNQSFQNFEIIISEDASHESMVHFCANYNFSHPVQHLSHPDVGWQKNLALNRAIVAAKSNYLIFVDGDCILHPRFVEEHLRLASKDGVVAGKRVKLNDELSSLLIEDVENYAKIEKRLKKMLFCGSKSGNGFIEEGIFVEPNSFLGHIVSKFRGMTNLKGCNMSFSKDAAYAINGFDQDYTLPAIGEDIDLVWRFEAAGYHLVSARNFAVQYHLNHKENWTDQSENIAKMEAKQLSGKFFCNNGIVKRKES